MNAEELIEALEKLIHDDRLCGLFSEDLKILFQFEGKEFSIESLEIDRSKNAFIIWGNSENEK